MSDESQQPTVPEFYVDQFRLTTGAYTVSMTFGISEPHPVPGKHVQPQEMVLLRMSLQHAKVMSMILRRQLKTLEREAGVISLPPQLCSQLGVSLEDW